MPKIKNATKTQSPEGSQRNDDQMFKTADSLCLCAFVAKLYLSEMTQICKFYFFN
jgi:hypothetical protein